MLQLGLEILEVSDVQVDQHQLLLFTQTSVIDLDLLGKLALARFVERVLIQIAITAQWLVVTIHIFVGAKPLELFEELKNLLIDGFSRFFSN